MKKVLKIVLKILFGLSAVLMINQGLQGGNIITSDSYKQSEGAEDLTTDSFTTSKLSIISKENFSTSIVVNNIAFVDYSNEGSYSHFRRGIPFQKKHNIVVFSGYSDGSAEIRITVNEEMYSIQMFQVNLRCVQNTMQIQPT